MIFGAFARTVRDIGAMNACLYATSRLLGMLTRGRARLVKYYITAQPVPDGEITPARRGRQIDVREAGRAEILALPFDRPRTVLDARLANGCRCLVARKNGAPLGFQWFTLRDYAEDEVRCLFRLAPDDHCAWDFDIFVLPEARAQPVFTRLWDKCHEILRQSGVRTTLSRINAYNGGSLRAHERIGARVVGWVAFLCVGTLEFAAFSGPPWLHVSLRRSGAPVLDVSRLARAATPMPTETPA